MGLGEDEIKELEEQVARLEKEKQDYRDLAIMWWIRFQNAMNFATMAMMDDEDGCPGCHVWSRMEGWVSEGSTIP